MWVIEWMDQPTKESGPQCLTEGLVRGRFSIKIIAFHLFC